MEDFSLRSCAALLKCASREATRDGESSHETKPPPRELLLVAIACVCSGAVFGIPIQRLRDGGRKKLDLSGIGPDAAHLLALLLPGTKTRSLLVGFQPLPIMKLRGTKPAESINLSGRGLSSACIIIIASCIKGNAVLKKLDLSFCEICGVDEDGYGTYTVEALNQLCEGLKGKRCAITDLNLDGNQLCGISHDGCGYYTEKGIEELCERLEGTTITRLSIKHNQLDAGIAAELAEVINANVPLDDDDSLHEGSSVSEEPCI